MGQLFSSASVSGTGIQQGGFVGLENGAVKATVKKDGVVGLQKDAVNATGVERGGIVGVQDGAIRAAIQKDGILGVQNGGMVGLQNGAVRAGIEKHGIIGMQKDSIRATGIAGGINNTFHIEGLVVALVSIICMMILGATILSSQALLLVFLVVIILFGIFMFFEREKRLQKYENEAKAAERNQLMRDYLELLEDPTKKMKHFESILDSLKDREGIEKLIDVPEFMMKLEESIERFKKQCIPLMKEYIQAKALILSQKEMGTLKISKMIAEFTQKVDENCKPEEIETKWRRLLENHKATPQNCLSRKMKTEGQKVSQETDKSPTKIMLPLKQIYSNISKKIRLYSVGPDQPLKATKNIIMVGMTGSGKSLMINYLVNYFYGVEFKDDFRLAMILKEDEIEEREGNSTSEAESVTSWVTAYQLNWQEGSRTDFNLMLLDTPGFGDTRGIAEDEKIIDRIRDFYNDEKACPLQEIAMVGFVVQSGLSRLTEEQKYIFDNVLNIFGKDIKDNVSILFTFADLQQPPALKTIESYNIPFNGSFKFNNSAVYAPNNDVDVEEFEQSWNFGVKNIKRFFAHLGSVTPTSLKMTKEVLAERDHLKCILQGLEKSIRNGMSQLQSIEVMCDDILTLKGTVKQNENYKVKSEVEVQRTETCDHDITNCVPCMFTCHSPCYIAGDNKRGCASMKNGVCQRCPGKCAWGSHQNGSKIYVYTPNTREETISDMLEKYNIATNKKNAKKELLLKLLEEYKAYKTKLFLDIESAAEKTKRLEEIAMKNSYLTNVDYIERLIESERMGKRPNKEKRLEQLFEVLGMAKTLSDVRDNPDSQTHGVSEYEKTVVDRINNMEEDLEVIMDYRPPFRYDRYEKTNISNEKKLEMYALYKQATYGDNTAGKPYFWSGTDKWDAWTSKKGMSQSDARDAYMSLGACLEDELQLEIS